MTMTSREQVLAILGGRQPDQVPWFGDLSYWYGYLAAENKLAPAHQGAEGIYQLHRDLGVGFYLQGYFPFKQDWKNEGLRPISSARSVSVPVFPPVVESVTEGDLTVTTIKTPHGTLRQGWKALRESYTGAPVEHFVKDWHDLAAVRFWYENMAFEPDYQEARARQGRIGDNGITLCYLPKSPLMQMIALDAGVNAVFEIFTDAGEEFHKTMDVVRRSHDAAASIESLGDRDLGRISNKFATLYVSGCFAVRFKILPFTEAEVLAALLTCHRDHVAFIDEQLGVTPAKALSAATAPGDVPAPAEQPFDRLRRFRQRQPQERLP